MVNRSPVLGYNTNVRHGGKLYHIQTEDSGVKHPHIITHLFADGGRIVASRKSSYATHLGAEHLPDIVKGLMREQHKGMFISLRDGEFDEPGAEGMTATSATAVGAHAPGPSAAPPAAARSRAPSQSMEKAASPPAGLIPGAGRYQAARPVLTREQPEAVVSALDGKTDPPPRPAAPTITLDEVILSYLAQDLAAEGRA